MHGSTGSGPSNAGRSDATASRSSDDDEESPRAEARSGGAGRDVASPGGGRNARAFGATSAPEAAPPRPCPRPCPSERCAGGGGLGAPRKRDDINATISKRTREAVSPRRGRFCTAEKSRRRPLQSVVADWASFTRPTGSNAPRRSPPRRTNQHQRRGRRTRSAEARALATTSPTGPPDASYARGARLPPARPGWRRPPRPSRRFLARSAGVSPPDPARAPPAPSPRAPPASRACVPAQPDSSPRWWTARRSAPPRTTSAARCSSAPSAPPAASCSSAAASPTSPPPSSSRSRARSGTTSSATPAWRRASSSRTIPRSSASATPSTRPRASASPCSRARRPPARPRHGRRDDRLRPRRPLPGLAHGPGVPGTAPVRLPALLPRAPPARRRRRHRLRRLRRRVRRAERRGQGPHRRPRRHLFLRAPQRQGQEANAELPPAHPGGASEEPPRVPARGESRARVLCTELRERALERRRRER